MVERFDIRQDDRGWTVLDACTSRPLIIMEVPQVGLDVQDALDLVDALEWPTIRERRSFQN
jgi:hypothetical protein